MPKVRRPKKGWAVPRRRRPRPPRISSEKSRLAPRCPSCGEQKLKMDVSRSERYCSSCGAIV